MLDADNWPKQRYIDAGYFRLDERSYHQPGYGKKFYMVTLVTEKGLAWLREQQAVKQVA